MTWKQFNKFLDFLIWGAFFLAVTAPIHEWFHWITGKALGGEMACVTFTDILSGYCRFTNAPDLPWLFYLSGGLGTGLLFILLGLRALKTPTLLDEPIVFSSFLVGFIQLGYGVGEMFAAWYPEHKILAMAIGAVVGGTMASIFVIPKIGDWIEQN